ncbi:MAG TPA: hypothetical protein VFN78_12975 [Ktedonobacterales bacterium]|nr:hypothetical protein [Ktedonobacterales bacterium]
MKLILRGACGVTLALVLVGLILLLSAANDVSRDALGVGLINLGDKLSVILALITSLYAGQRSDWRWVAALALGALCSLLGAPLSAATNTGILIFVVAPLAVALVALVYTFRMRGSLAPTQAWWRV